MSFPVRTSSRLTMVVTPALALMLALAGCSTTETSSTTSSAISDDATSSASDGSASTDGSAADTSGATLGSDAAMTTTTATAQGTTTTLEAGDKAFTVDAPAGWKDGIDTAPKGTVLAAQSTTRTGSSFNTLVVTKGDSVADLDEVVAASIETLKDDDADVRAAKDIEIDGQNAYGFSTTVSAGDDTVTNRLHYVNFDGSLYTLTFSTSQVDGEISKLADQEFDDILDSWSWSSKD